MKNAQEPSTLGDVIGVLVIGHGALPEALLETVTDIAGPFPSAEALGIARNQSLEEIGVRVRAAIRRVNRGHGVLILSDMFGGTASNVALELVGEDAIEIVTGCNLPMLLELSCAVREGCDLAALTDFAKHQGRQNVIVASRVLAERERGS